MADTLAGGGHKLPHSGLAYRRLHTACILPVYGTASVAVEVHYSILTPQAVEPFKFQLSLGTHL